MYLTWGDVSNAAKTQSITPNSVFNLPNIYYQLQEWGKPSPTNVSFLVPPDYCKAEVDAICGRYRFWRIKSLRIYIKRIQITSETAAQAATQVMDKSRFGIIYHYEPAPFPSSVTEDCYFRWKNLPLKKAVKIYWNPRQIGWFDQLVTGGSITTPFKMTQSGQRYVDLQAYTPAEWQQTHVTSTNELIGALGNFPLAYRNKNDGYEPIYGGPMFKNPKAVACYAMIQPNWVMTGTETIQFKIYQYVTLEFKENTEEWKA